MEMSISEFKKLKSECRICIGSKICPTHQKMLDEMLKEG